MAGVKCWAVFAGRQQMSLDGLLELRVTEDWLVSGAARLENFRVLIYQMSEIAQEMMPEHAAQAVQDQ